MKKSLCFIGSSGQFSFVVLQALLEKTINVQQIILSGYTPAIQRSKNLPVEINPSHEELATIPSLAALHNIPIHYVGDNINNFVGWKNFPHDTPPDFIFVACFPFRLPATLRQWPKEFSVNLHPSLLPRYRGPDPVFWQLRHAETKTGFSLHLLSEAFDAGPVLLQAPVNFPQGATRNELDALLAQQGAEAFCDLLLTPTLSKSTSSKAALKQTEQNETSASYHPPPQAEDFTLGTHWSAEHAYNFINGTHTPSDGYPILLDGQLHHIAKAQSFKAQQLLDKPYRQLDDEILIQFSPGVLRAKPV